MMPEGSFKSLVEQKLGTFPHVVMYVLLEWVMIIILFVDGLLAFVSNELAKFFELRIPCLLCTRIDHVLVHRNSNFYYNDSICEVHKKDISSLAYCHMHRKLSDIRSMCQGCLLSFATGKDADCDKYKSLVGILHRDIDCFMADERRLLVKPLKKDGTESLEEIKRCMPRCSCCEEPLKLKSASKKYMRSLSMNAPAPSPRAAWLVSRSDERSLELPHGKYSELKLTSGNDSEAKEGDSSNVDNQAAKKEDSKSLTTPLVQGSEDIPNEDSIRTPSFANEDLIRTPSFARGNRFFGIPLDSAQASPRFSSRQLRKMSVGETILEGNEANEADGDNLSRLKTQVRADHKSLMDLYMELDEERSASAIAANNAMAMITRLQAEKAAVQMEALQYQRMMEEQAEYDEEAMQVMRDMLLKREDEVKALESELDSYREKYGTIKRVGSEICEVDFDEDYQDMKSQALSLFDERSDCCSVNGADQNENESRYERNCEIGEVNQEELSLDFEGERSYLLGFLTDLEKKVKADEGPSSSELNKTEKEEENTGTKKATLTREVSLIKERLRAIEADSGFLKHAAMTLQSGGEGTKLLNEIAQHLRNLRHAVKSPSEQITDA